MQFTKGLQAAKSGLGVHLGYGIERTLQPLPLALDLALQNQQFFQSIGWPPSFTTTASKDSSLFVLTLIHPSDAARKLRER